MKEDGRDYLLMAMTSGKAIKPLTPADNKSPSQARIGVAAAKAQMIAPT
ncbi:hypothetical protein [Nitrospira japonica]|nr:hypothetical protein [Nitrospira japonica]